MTQLQKAPKEMALHMNISLMYVYWYAFLTRWKMKQKKFYRKISNKIVDFMDDGEWTTKK